MDMRKRLKKIHNYMEHLLILVSAITGCCISAFASLVGISIGFVISSVAALRTYVIT